MIDANLNFAVGWLIGLGTGILWSWLYVGAKARKNAKAVEEQK